MRTQWGRWRWRGASSRKSALRFQKSGRRQKNHLSSTTFSHFRRRMSWNCAGPLWTLGRRWYSFVGHAGKGSGFNNQSCQSEARDAGNQCGKRGAALDLGADYLVCQGTEAGGHVQANRGLYETLPDVLKEARQVPVIAAGGIANGDGIRKALLASASGAMLGTRFVATAESNAHPAYQRALMAAHAKDTVLTVCFERGWPNAIHRALRNQTFVMWEAAGCPPAGKRPGERDILATRPDGSQVLRYQTASYD